MLSLGIGEILVIAAVLVIFVGAIGGFVLSGIIGLFVGAVVVVLAYELFQAWLKAGTAVSAVDDSGAETPAAAD